ncbi:hypothetical protein ST47_g970 [Ascochyta rabiei]|uniref:Uncharacterized protein n=1 Tax=Didymella rabiei TaxID=5454 RepID=A0A163LL20_DIDRA|nr:hypothetical protein ST47_g970 [Ascochyta rabiei]
MSHFHQQILFQRPIFPEIVDSLPKLPFHLEVDIDTCVVNRDFTGKAVEKSSCVVRDVVVPESWDIGNIRSIPCVLRPHAQERRGGFKDIIFIVDDVAQELLKNITYGNCTAICSVHD